MRNRPLLMHHRVGPAGGAHVPAAADPPSVPQPAPAPGPTELWSSRRPSRTVRLRAWRHRRRLDHELARGATAGELEFTPELAYRSGQLLAAKRRHRLAANSLREALWSIADALILPSPDR